MRRIALALALVLVALPALARRERVPIRGQGKVLLVEATLNQRVTGWFILDTGASYCVISKETAAEANLSGRKDGEKVTMSTANGAVQATVGQARRIDVGAMAGRDIAVAVVDHDPFPGLRGLIGLSFLQQFKYSVDSRTNELLLEQ